MKVVVAFLVLISVAAASANVTERLVVHKPSTFAAVVKSKPLSTK